MSTGKQDWSSVRTGRSKRQLVCCCMILSFQHVSGRMRSVLLPTYTIGWLPGNWKILHHMSVSMVLHLIAPICEYLDLFAMLML